MHTREPLWHYELRCLLSSVTSQHAPYLGVQGMHEGIVVQALADVALHMAVMLLGKPAQALEQGWRTGRHKAGCNHRVDQRALEAPASHPALSQK